MCARAVPLVPSRTHAQNIYIYIYVLYYENNENMPLQHQKEQKKTKKQGKYMSKCENIEMPIRVWVSWVWVWVGLHGPMPDLCATLVHAYAVV